MYMNVIFFIEMAYIWSRYSFYYEVRGSLRGFVRRSVFCSDNCFTLFYFIVKKSKAVIPQLLKLTLSKPIPQCGCTIRICVYLYLIYCQICFNFNLCVTPVSFFTVYFYSWIKKLKIFIITKSCNDTQNLF